MLKNADMPAMPFIEPNTECSVATGLTKREMFAMHFHAALLAATDANGEWKGADVGAENIAVREADRLLFALGEKDERK